MTEEDNNYLKIVIRPGHELFTEKHNDIDLGSNLALFGG